jgi:hypothetical protein
MIHIYIGNHGKKDGIQDYIDILSHVMKTRGVEVEVSEKLHESGINVVIDEFTNFISNNQIASLAKSPCPARFVYVLTEFIEKRFMIRSFNHFGSLIDSAILAFFNLYLRWRRRDFKRASLRDYLAFVSLSPVLMLYGVWFLVRCSYRFFRHTRNVSTFLHVNSRVHHLIYMHMRYLGFEAMIEYADGIVFSHDAIRQGYEKFRSAGGDGIDPMGLLYPEFSAINLFPQQLSAKKLYVEMTGSITRYRSSFARKLNSLIVLLGLHHMFGVTMCYSFSDISKTKPNMRAAFSLHPPQSVTWPYSSPTRIYRALCVDKNIPVLTKNFKQHPIEDLCLMYEGEQTVLTMHELYTDKSALAGFLEMRIEPYLRLAKEANDRLCVQLFTLVANPKQEKNARIGRSKIEK